jgi:hypothetical protein
MTEIYEFADIAAILRIKKSQVKNWTSGRPFSVRPSVRVSSGKGSRNLFSRADLYCFELVKRLNDVGAPVQAIQELLGGGTLSYEPCWKENYWVVVSRSFPRHSLFETLFSTSFSGSFQLDPEHKVVCYYAVNLSHIVEHVQAMIAVFEGKARRAMKQSSTSPSKKAKSASTAGERRNKEPKRGRGRETTTRKRRA